MLPPFIIEQIRQREERERARQEERQPRLDLPLDRIPPRRSAAEDEDEPNRGVVVVDLGA